MTTKRTEKEALDKLVKAMETIIRPKPKQGEGKGEQRK